MSIETILTDDQIFLAPKIPDFLAIKREQSNGKLKIHISAPHMIYQWKDYKDFFDHVAEFFPEVANVKQPIFTGHKNVMFGKISLAIKGQNIEIIVYPDKQIADYAISERNEDGISYLDLLPPGFFNKIVYYFV